MAKLYPPYIEGTLPAFCLNSAGDGTITIPFAHNQAVSKADIGSKIYVKVKTVQNDVLMGSDSADWTETVDSKTVIGDGQVVIPVSGYSALNGNWPMQIGQFYKIQLAYGDKNNIVGYYSTVGVIKCTSKPEVTIVDMSEDKVNNNNNLFVGQFKQAKGGDVTEKVYSSKFTITDLQGNEIATTGEVLHNVENNPNSYTSIDEMHFNRDLEFGEIYKIKYEVITNNGLECSSPEYLLTQQKSLTMSLKGTLKATLNYEEGFIDVSIVGYRDEKGVEEIGNGAFILCREDSLNPGYWDELGRFSLKYESPTKTIFRDFTIEQGKTYTYSIQQYNQHKVYSDRKKSNKVYADFEDMFLFDGERQLKLQFNPQVSNFKTQLAETRSETIGSKYPFFFRNARVGYKTFPISGLISMLIDDNQFFTTYKNILREEFVYDRHDAARNKRRVKNVYDHHWDINKNYTSERLFKLEVLDWFNNGKVKLFKSPAEGNYLVRLMDTSLAPQAPLGRMLHTISSTAYECAENVYSNMVQYGIIEDSAKSITAENTYVTQWYEQSIKSIFDDAIKNGQEFFPEPVKGDGEDESAVPSEYRTNNLLQSDLGEGETYTTVLSFTDLMPGSKIRLVFARDGEFEQTNPDAYKDIIIGATGNYYADDTEPIYGIYMIQKNTSIESTKESRNQNLNNLISGAGEYVPKIQPNSLDGSITYQYSVPVRNSFNSIVSIETDIGSNKQFVGPVEDLVTALNCAKEQATRITMSRYFKRPVEYLFYKGQDLNDFDENLYLEGYNANNYRDLVPAYSDKLFWDTNYTGTFDEKEHMEYSPFSIYVLRNSYATVNGVKQDILAHIEHSLEKTDETHTHIADHMFEKYYIDRYIYAQTAEDMLTERMALVARIAASKDEVEKMAIQEALAANPLYVLDSIAGKVYKAGENYIYDPVIYYNNEQIDLREIQRYDLNNLEPTETKLKVGNGVYCDVFYQKVTMNYSFEDTDETLHAAKTTYYNELNRLTEKRNSGQDPQKSELDILNTYYDNYNRLLAETIESWVTRETDLELGE